jgi:hypothetical protein
VSQEKFQYIGVQEQLPVSCQALCGRIFLHRQRFMDVMLNANNVNSKYFITVFSPMGKGVLN